MPWTENAKVVDLRRSNRFVDAVVETLDGFRRHLTGRNAALVTYYGFLTLFPLFLAASTILGFVLESRPELREDLVDSAAAQIPFIGNQLGGELNGSWIALIVGLSVALWGSMKAFIGLQISYDDIWEVDVDDRSTFVTQRGRALIGLAVIGGAQIATVALSSVVAEAGLPGYSQWLLVMGGLVINVAVVAAMYRFLTTFDVTWAMVWPGALFAGALYSIIQFFGTRITAALARNDTYGNFSTVLALLTWLSLHAIINLFGAEINAARHRIGARTTPADTAAAPSAAH